MLTHFWPILNISTNFDLITNKSTPNTQKLDNFFTQKLKIFDLENQKSKL